MSRIRRIAAAIGVSAALAGGLVTVATPAAAAGSCVQIYRIVYNSAGTDNRSNTSLNGEWIQLRNGCSVASTLTSARFKDAAGHVYTFAAYTLGARK